MSTIGTGIAAGVAQTAQNAQQVGRAQDSRRGEAARRAQDQAELFEERVYAPEQTEDSDGELPDRQAPGYERLYGPPAPADPPAEEPADPSPPEAPLYQHLDIEA